MTPKLALTIVQVLCGLILIAVVMLQAGALAGLEEHDDNDCQTAEKLQDRDDER